MNRMSNRVDELDRVGTLYLEHLTDADMRTLVRAEQVSEAQAEARSAALRREPALVLDVLDRPAVSAELLNLASDRRSQQFTFISPFLVFAAAIHRTAADLAHSSYAPERAAPRLRVPVFDGPQLAEYLAGAWHRLFLAELLASFARTTSGVVLTRTPHGLRRRRWHELDPASLAMLLEASPESDRPLVWRRLGDVALFLAGVFPDALDRMLVGRADPTRMAALTGLEAPPAPNSNAADLFEWFGVHWYRAAAAHAVAATAMIAILRDNADNFHHARRVLNTAADRYLFPITNDWLPNPG